MLDSLSFFGKLWLRKFKKLIIMDTSKIEALLSQLLDKQDELILRISSLEETIQSQLTETNSSIDELKYSASQINDELNWYGEGHSLAKQILKGLDAIEVAVVDR